MLTPSPQSKEQTRLRWDIEDVNNKQQRVSFNAALHEKTNQKPHTPTFMNTDVGKCKLLNTSWKGVKGVGGVGVGVFSLSDNDLCLKKGDKSLPQLEDWSFYRESRPVV